MAEGAARRCQVQRDGHWYPGFLLGWYRQDGRWRGVVRYRVSPGEQYQEARWEEDLRPEDPA